MQVKRAAVVLLLLMYQPAGAIGDDYSYEGISLAVWRKMLIDQDPRNRARAAFAIGCIRPSGKEAIPDLVKRLHDEDSNVRISAGDALASLDATEAIPNLIALLLTYKGDTEAADQVGWFLRQLGGKSIQFLIRELETTNNPTDREIIIRILGAFGPGEAEAAIPLIAKYIANDYIGTLEALEKMGPAAIPAILTGLKSQENRVRERAAKALGVIGPKAQIAIPALLDLLEDIAPDLRAEAASALGAIGAEDDKVIPALMKALHDPHREVRMRAANALSKYGPRARIAVPVLIETLNREIEEIDADTYSPQTQAATALGSVGWGAYEAIPSFLEILDRRGKQDRMLRVESSTAIQRIASSLHDEQHNLSDADLIRATSRLEEADKVLEGFRPPIPWKYTHPEARDLPYDVVRQAHSTLLTEQNARRSRQQARIALLACGIVIAFAIIVWIVLTVPAVYRWLLIRRGRRWVLVASACPSEVTVRVVGGKVEAQVQHRYDSTPNPQSEMIPGDILSTWTAGGKHPERRQQALLNARNSPEIVRIRNQVHGYAKTSGLGRSILVDVHDDLFALPWAWLLGSRWGVEVAETVAGQVTPNMKPPHRGDLQAGPRPPMGRQIVVGLVVNDEPTSGLRNLRFAQGEASALRKQCRNVRARLIGSAHASDATVAAFRQCLAQADVVHVIAHAEPSWIDLQQERFTADHLSGLAVRTRLLVVSGCKIGDPLRGAARPLVAELVSRGVNILAATAEVDDNPCRWFFEQFYSSFFPIRGMAGQSIADAVKDAVGACSRVADERARDGIDVGDWRSSIDPFTLYGNPSVRLVLADPVTIRGAANAPSVEADGETDQLGIL